MKNLKKYEYKYHLADDKFIFVPTPEMLFYGKKIKKEIEAVWKCPSYYYHLLPTGHIGALKEHINNDWFLIADIRNFFYQINQTKITRSLNQLFHNYNKSREIAKLSTVFSVFNNKKSWHLPYGFPQSSIISSVCLKNSFLGTFLENLKKDGYAVSVYVDDIIISGKLDSYNFHLRKMLENVAKKSNLELNSKKTHLSKRKITVFNINVYHLKTRIERNRKKSFLNVLKDKNTNPSVKLAIKKYMEIAEM